MKIAIAGGSGFIGRHLVHALLREDHEVVILSRNPNRVRAALPHGATVVAWDTTGTDLDWAVELANAAAVVNLCAAPPLGAINSLVDAMASLPAADRPRAFLNASSIEIYGDTADAPAAETAGVGESARARLWLEREAAALAAEQLAVRVVLLRTALVIARDLPVLNRLALLGRLFVGGPVGSGAEWLSWIHIDDAVALIIRAISSWDIGGPLNLAAPQAVSRREFAANVEKALGRPTSLAMPSWIALAALGPHAALLHASHRVWPAKALHSSYEFKVPALATAVRLSLGSASGAGFAYRRL